MNLHDLLHTTGRESPEAEAVSCGGVRLSYRELVERVRRLGNVLIAAGLERGDRVAILSPNCHTFLESYFAAAGADLVLVPVNTRLTARDLAFILDDSGAQMLIAHPELRDLVAESAAENLLFTGPEYEAALRSAEDGALPASAAGGDIAQIYYTSGTTGTPKGVMLTHANVATHARAAISEFRLTCADVWAHVAPLFHLADAWATFAVTAAGGRHVIVPRFDPSRVLATFREERVTLTNLIPTMLNSLVREEGAGDAPYPSLRYVLSGGAPISPALVRRIMETFSTEYVQTYGLTETSPYLTVSLLDERQRVLPEEERFRLASRTGRKFEGVELRVVDENGREVEPDDLEVGEILARGPTVTPGYWNRPEETAAAFADGWLRTGDLAVIDAEGFLNIVDRIKDVIITGGENVYSTEVEHALHEHPSVQEVAVIGVPDEHWGETVKAVVALSQGAEPDEAALIEFCRERLAGFKIPRAVEFVDELPKTATGKIRKRSLR
jgi:acyl-CoA synthetase (AMP-forming)/AMP-acid ligase II